MEIHLSLLGPLVSYEENEVLRIRSHIPTKHYGDLVLSQ